MLGGRRALALCCAPVLSALMCAAALASPGSDFEAVYRKWMYDGEIPNCRFSQVQLLNARNEAHALPDLAQYSPSFDAVVGTALAVHDRGGCRGVARPPSRRRLAKSALRNVRIAQIRPRGRESVVLTNRGSRAVSLAGATLRDRSGRRVRLSGVVSARSSRRVASRGVWNDGGDVVKLADRRGLIVRQTGFGSWAGVVRF